ncbi:hypothetical protein VNO77_18120 [Canavalia gladiata]|uniref:Uncharacterized protein n=1 Tax=Canavalia gladiata TaxID=3824 RepID=A0AAN9LNL2_CANGL
MPRAFAWRARHGMVKSVSRRRIEGRHGRVEVVKAVVAIVVGEREIPITDYPTKEQPLAFSVALLFCSISLCSASKTIFTAHAMGFSISFKKKTVLITKWSLNKLTFRSAEDRRLHLSPGFQ